MTCRRTCCPLARDIGETAVVIDQRRSPLNLNVLLRAVEAAPPVAAAEVVGVLELTLDANPRRAHHRQRRPRGGVQGVALEAEVERVAADVAGRLQPSRIGLRRR
jgi:hypothetical protein